MPPPPSWMRRKIGGVRDDRRRYVPRPQRFAQPGAAQLGRARLRTDMSTPALSDQLVGCQCGRCSPPRWQPAEVEAAVRHLSNRQALDLALDRVAVSSFTSCDHCGAWVPTLRPVEPASSDGCEVVMLPVVRE